MLCCKCCVADDNVIVSEVAPAAAYVHELCALGTTAWTRAETAGLHHQLANLQAGLRHSADTWHAALRAARVTRAPVAGSIALRLIVLCVDAGRPPLLLSTNSSAGDVGDVASATQAVIARRHSTSVALAGAFAQTLLTRIRSINDAALRDIQTSVSHADTTHCVVRLALRHVDSVEVSVFDNAVWFAEGHANVLVLHQPSRTGVLVEPAGASTVPALAAVLKVALQLPGLKLIHNLHYQRQVEEPPVDAPVAGDDGLCTLWCAIYGVLMICADITTPEDFWALFKHIESRRGCVLRGFVRGLQHDARRAAGGVPGL